MILPNSQKSYFFVYICIHYLVQFKIWKAENF